MTHRAAQPICTMAGSPCSKSKWGGSEGQMGPVEHRGEIAETSPTLQQLFIIDGNKKYQALVLPLMLLPVLFFHATVTASQQPTAMV